MDFQNKLDIVTQIQENTVTTLHFTADDDDVIDDIRPVIDAIKDNSSIVKVEFLDDFLGCVRNDSRSELLQALCHASHKDHDLEGYHPAGHPSGF